MSPIQRAASIIEYLRIFIEKQGLEVLARYPNDLLVHDRNTFENLGMPGMRFGWVADHSSTHLITIGVHRKEMELIPTLADSTTRKYLEIGIPYAGPVEYIKHSRETFAKLATKEVPFSAVGSRTDFEVHSNGRKLGRIIITDKGCLNDSHTRTFAATIHPSELPGSTKDRPVLLLWAEHAVTAVAGTLFRYSDIQVKAAA